MSTSNGRASASRMATRNRGGRALPTAEPGASLGARAPSSSSFCGEKGAQGILVNSGQSFPVTEDKEDLTWASHSRACKIFLRSQRLRAVTMATWPCTHSSFCIKDDQYVGESTGPLPRGQMPAGQGKALLSSYSR